MRFAKYILMFVAFAVATACTMTDVDEVVVAPVQSQGIKIVSRILPFADYDVSTRAAKNSKETEAKTLDFVILGKSGNCIFYKHTNGETTISLDKEADFGRLSVDEYSTCGIYILVNYPALYDKVKDGARNAGSSSTEEYIKDYIVGKQGGSYFAGATPVQPTSQIPDAGLPMYGSKTDVDLSNFSNGEAITVPVESLYSKIVFDISVNPTQSMPKTPVFKLNGYTIKNLATTLDILGGTESVRVEDDTTSKVTVVSNIKGTSDSVDGVHDAVEGDLTGVDTKADQEVSFSFYLPERYLQIGDVDAFGYPFGSGADIRQEDARYRQRYKPLLAKGFTNYEANQQTKVADPMATYVTFYGVYTTHQGHSYNVEYDIYVGNDNYSNFDIVRNRQYNNTIVIKGVTNADDQTSVTNAVAIDHRVTVSRTQPAIINLRRETLLDSHFEVRPMRIRKNSDGASEVTHAKISVVDGIDWMRLEYNNGTGSATGDHCANGKRKYFTTDLVTNTLASNTSVVVPLTDSNQTVWIYIDENLEVGDNVRLGDITVQYGNANNDGSDFVADADKKVTYTICQRHLYPVATTRNANIDGSSTRSTTYYIEYEEEYLYDFDAEDSFGKTDQSGMAWGLDGVQLSNSIDAADVTYNMSGWGSFLASLGWDQVKLFKEVFTNLNIKYDFYLWRDVKDVDALKNATPQKYSCFDGHTYNKNIVTTLKGLASSNSKAKVDGIQLDEQPQSAIAYCYNKNKRKSDGTIDVNNIKWYLPAIDEVEDIAEFAYDFKGGVFQGNLYWSCQPAYYQNELSLDLWKRHITRGWGDTGDDVPGFYYTDDTTHARATRALKEYNTTTGKYEFAGVLDSGSDLYGTQGGQLRVCEIPIIQEVYVQDIDANHYTKNPNFGYGNHPGNLSRTGQKARVRCVRIDTNAVK